MIERLVLAVIDAVILASALAMPVEMLFAPFGMAVFMTAITILIVTLLLSPFIDLLLSRSPKTPCPERKPLPIG
jgi:hypothetical protein